MTRSERVEPKTLWPIIGGLKARVLVAGAGRPVLVLHGWDGSCESIYPVSRMLEGVGEVYTVDLPGFGSSERPPGAWGTKEYAAFLHDLLDVLQLDRVTLVGHSFGGRIAIRLATECPDRVEQMVLIAPAGIKPQRDVSYYRKVALAKVGRLLAFTLGGKGKALQARIVKRSGSKDYLEAGHMRGSFVRIVNEDLAPCLAARIRVRGRYQRLCRARRNEGLRAEPFMCRAGEIPCSATLAGQEACA